MGKVIGDGVLFAFNVCSMDANVGEHEEVCEDSGKCFSLGTFEAGDAFCPSFCCSVVSPRENHWMNQDVDRLEVLPRK